MTEVSVIHSLTHSLTHTYIHTSNIHVGLHSLCYLCFFIPKDIKPVPVLACAS